MGFSIQQSYIDLWGNHTVKYKIVDCDCNVIMEKIF